jgi:hypothetical protein
MIRLRAFGLALAALLIAAASSAASLAASQREGPTVTATQARDSVRVVASWGRGCDLRGCPDSIAVTWSVGGIAQAPRITRARTDTLWLTAPAWGSSVTVTVTVTTYRRGLASAPASATTTVRRTDAPPPAVDSLRVDTLALRIELERVAEADSFPVIVVRRAVDYSTESRMVVGDSTQLCAIGRNRYTGRIALFVEWEVSDAELQRIESACAEASDAYAAERSG